MKVVFVNRFFYPDHSATSQILSDLALDLGRVGVGVEVVTSRLRYDDPEANLPARETVAGVDVLRVWSSRFGRRWLLGRAVDYLTFYAAAFLALLRRVRAGDAVVAMTDPPLVAAPAAVAARVRGALLVNWLQDVFPEIAQRLGVPGLGGLPGRGLLALRDWTLRVARVNVVLGERMAELVLARRGVERAAVRVVHNWADGHAVRPVAPEVNPLRAEWGLTDRFVVGYSGNLGRVHDFASVLEAAERLRDEARIVFLFIGAGARRDAVETRVRQLGLTNVLFRPYQPRARLAQALSAPDVHLVSLRPELEGLVVPSKFYGIAAAGRPTVFIGAHDGEVARLVVHFGAGYAVAPTDGAGLAALLARLAESPDQVAAAGARARAMLESEFERSRAVATWLEVLAALGPAWKQARERASRVAALSTTASRERG
jgi:glycosyltransferase involved in cell wall biosynthesis